jgi:polar amino acid transport system substrate-binding protein
MFGIVGLLNQTGRVGNSWKGYAMSNTPKAHQLVRLFGVAVLLATVLTSHALAQTAKLSLTTGALPPLVSSPGHPGFITELARAMFKRVGVEVEVTTVPTERSLINVNAGLDDGDIFRVAGVEAQFPNVIRIPEKTLDNDFVVFTKRSDIKIRTWADLQPYSVAYATGWKPYERNVLGVKELTKTPSINELPALLEKGRVDVILMDRWQGQWVVRQSGFDFHLLEPPLARFEMFMYLHKKHAALVPRAAKALADMKADGSYQKLYAQYLKPLEGR